MRPSRTERSRPHCVVGSQIAQTDLRTSMPVSAPGILAFSLRAVSSTSSSPSPPPERRRCSLAAPRRSPPSAHASGPARRTSPNRLNPTSRPARKPSTAREPSRSSTSTTSAAASDPPLANSRSPACWMLQAARPGQAAVTPAIVSPATRPCRRALAQSAVVTRSPVSGSSVRATSPAASRPGAGDVIASSTSMPPCAHEAAVFEEAEVGARPGAHHGQVERLGHVTSSGVGRVAPAGAGPDGAGRRSPPVQTAVAPLHGAHDEPEPEVEPTLRQVRAPRLAAHAGCAMRGRTDGLTLDDDDIEPRALQDARYLDTGERGAHDQRAWRRSGGRAHARGRHGAAQQHRVVERPQHEDAGAGEAGHRRHGRRRSRGHQALDVGEALAGRGRERARRRVDVRHRRRRVERARRRARRSRRHRRGSSAAPRARRRRSSCPASGCTAGGRRRRTGRPGRRSRLGAAPAPPRRPRRRSPR